MADATIADLAANTLANAGGGTHLGHYRRQFERPQHSLRRLRKIEWMHVRHEEAAAFAAGAEAAVTSRLAVCAAAPGPAICA